MLYAKVVFSLAIEGPFDYLVPPDLAKKIQLGARVRVPFRTQKMLGFVVGLSRKTKIKRLKEVLEVIDEKPLLGSQMLLLTQKVSQYYCCSWGEVIDTALPAALRKTRHLPGISVMDKKRITEKNIPILIHALDINQRWQAYLEEIKKVSQKNDSIIVLVTDVPSIFKAKEIIERETKLPVSVLYRKQPKESDEWNKIRTLESSIVVGTRSAIFAPVNNLGLMVIDEEENSIYKQEQVPHYHAREVALMRAEIEQAKLILGSSAPSLEAFYAAKNAKMKYIRIAESHVKPEVKIIDTREFSFTARHNNIIFSKYLVDLISANLNSRGKTLIFINRKGFANLAVCSTCGKVLKCPRCSTSLMYHFQGNTLNCRFCNFSMPAPNICPDCNSGYIKYSGAGTEKIESEIHRLFPQAKIKMVDSLHKANKEEADIFIATEAIIKATVDKFELTCVLSIDNSLNRVDLRSTEKVFSLLLHLLSLTKNTLIIQTGLAKLHCFRALANSDDSIFYEEEFLQRKNIGFPPYKHLALIKLRSKNEAKVDSASHELYEQLKKLNSGKKIEIISVGPYQVAKLRDYFYWQILVKAVNPFAMSKFLKINSKNFAHSGIIITVDVDPL